MFLRVSREVYFEKYEYNRNWDVSFSRTEKTALKSATFDEYVKKVSTKRRSARAFRVKNVEFFWKIIVTVATVKKR